MTDAEISRMAYRVDMLARRIAGLDLAYRRAPSASPLDRAERIADALRARDLERDSRRMCLECRFLQRTGDCRASGNPQRGAHQPVADILFRCPRFAWQTPA